MQDNDQKSYDLIIIFSIFFISIVGISMVASTSIPIAMNRFSEPYLYLYRHIMNFIISFVLMICVMMVPTQKWRDHATTFCFISFILSLVVLIWGVKINGSRRWIPIMGHSIQISELVKFSFLIYVADFLHRKRDDLYELKSILPLCFITFLLVTPILIEPDFGCVVVMMYSLFSLLWISNMPKKFFFAISLIIVIILSFIIILEPYRVVRLMSFLDPWEHRFDSGYQLTQSIVAFIRGGLTGMGYGNSMTKLFYLPESHTDFLFSVLAEEWGSIGAIMMLLLYALVILRCIYHASYRYAEDQLFESYIIFGWSQWVFIQVFINVGATTGLLPTKGLTLPFMSYGGSSLMIQFVMLGIVLRMIKSPILERP